MACSSNPGPQATVQPSAEELLPPDPAEFFTDYLTPLSDYSAAGAICICPQCQDPGARLWCIETCEHLVHRKCLIHWFTRLNPDKNTCPECKVPLIQYMPIFVKSLAEKAGIAIESELLSEPVNEFGRIHTTVEDLHQTELKVIKTVVELFLSYEIPKAQQGRKPEYLNAYYKIMDKITQAGLPYTKYLSCPKPHEQEEFKCGVCDYVLKRIQELHPQSVGSPELVTLEEELKDVKYKAEELIDSYQAEKLMQAEGTAQ